MGMDNWIYAYYQRIKNGSIVVGKYILRIYEILVQGLESHEYFYDQKKADDAISWIEAHCFHVEGEKAPGNLELELWQKAFVAAIFGIVDEKGHRQFREVLLVVARKCGKSLLAAAIAQYMWRQEGGFGTKVFCIAPKLDQADIVYNTIWTMCQLDPAYQEQKELLDERDEHNKRINDDSELPRHRMTDLCIPGTNSTVKKIAFQWHSVIMSATTKDISKKAKI